MARAPSICEKPSPAIQCPGAAAPGLCRCDDDGTREIGHGTRRLSRTVHIGALWGESRTTPSFVRDTKLETPMRTSRALAAASAAMLLLGAIAPSALGVENRLPDGTHDGFDHLYARRGECYANGWAVDPDDVDAPVTVRILLDGEVLTEVEATEYRQDIVDAGIDPAGTAGFTVFMGLLGITFDVPHEVLVEARDAQTAEWRVLDGSPRTIVCSNLWASTTPRPASSADRTALPRDGPPIATRSLASGLACGSRWTARSWPDDRGPVPPGRPRRRSRRRVLRVVGQPVRQAHTGGRACRASRDARYHAEAICGCRCSTPTSHSPAWRIRFRR